MEKSQRQELIAALVTDRYSGFKDGDESVLEACADARLEEFRAAADARKVEEARARSIDTELVKANARLKVTEEKLRTAEQNPSEEEWLAKAPARVKTLLDAQKAEEDAERSSIVSQLKDLGNHTEPELKGFPLEKLRELAAYARIQIPDFSGRGVAKERNAAANTTGYAPPDPYAAALASRRGESKMVN